MDSSKYRKELRIIFGYNEQLHKDYEKKEKEEIKKSNENYNQRSLDFVLSIVGKLGCDVT